MDVMYLFDEREQVAGIVDEIVELTHAEASYACFARFRTDVELGKGWGVGFRCVDGRFRIFEIDNAVADEAAGTVSVNATDAAVRELLDEPVTDKRPTNTTAAGAVMTLMEGTRFTLGQVTATGAGSMRAYYQSVWAALETARTAYGCEIVPYVEFADGRVTSRRVDVLSRLGMDRGRVFEVGDDAQNVTVDIDYSGIKTALYGRGKGVEIEGDEDTGTSYGRRLTFADVEWSVAKGDPVDKPLGQEWIGDPRALEAFGRDGRHRYGIEIFEDVTDANELLQKTWERLQTCKDPIVTVGATVADTESIWGRSHEAVRLGDDVGVHIPKKKVFVQARVVDIVRDYVRPARTQLTIGNARITSGCLMQSMRRQLDSYADRAAVWDRANAFDLDGVMDVMNNRIKSTKGRWYTEEETGGIMFVSDDEQLAMRLTGAGWQIANGKTGDAWNWRTAATGEGLVADVIYTGVLNANLVQFQGTGTYFDGTTLRIKHPQVDESAQTELGIDGFKMMRDGKIIGGLYKLKDKIISAVQTLFNPDAPRFEARVGKQNGVGLEGAGIDLVYNGVVGGHVGTYTKDEKGNDPPAGVTLFSEKETYVIGEEALRLSSENGDVDLTAGKGMEFSFVGKDWSGRETRLRFTAQEVWNLLNGVIQD